MTAVQKHAEIRCNGEPFHPPKSKPKPYAEMATDLPSFQVALEKLFEDYNGFKHLFPQVEESWNLHLIRRPDVKVIFLHRRDILKMAVSMYISRQTQYWDKNTEVVKNHPFDALDPKWVARITRRFRKMKRFYQEKLESGPKPYFEVLYEDLYGPDKDPETQLATIESILGFIGVDKPLTDKEKEKVRETLAYSNRLNSEETYNRIPNIMEIEKKFGSKKNGYLFK
jgi:hypothetical protein